MPVRSWRFNPKTACSTFCRSSMRMASSPGCLPPGGRLERDLHARFRCRVLLRMAERVATELVHGGSDHSSRGACRRQSPQAEYPTVLLAHHSLGLGVALPDILHGLESLFGVPVIETYGMTEAASQIAANRLELRKVGSVGRAAGAEIAILDGEGRPLAQPASTERSYCAVPPSRGDTTTIPPRPKRPSATVGFEPAISDISIATVISSSSAASRRSSTGEGRSLALRGRGGLAQPSGCARSRRLRRAARAAWRKCRGRRGAAAEVPTSTAQFYAPSRRTSRTIQGAGPDPHRGRNSERSQRKDQARALSAALSRDAGEAGDKLRDTPAARNWNRNSPRSGAQLLELDEIGVDQDVFRARRGFPRRHSNVFAPARTLRRRISPSRRFSMRRPSRPSQNASNYREADPLEVLAWRHAPAKARGTRLSFQQQRIYVLSRLDPTRSTITTFSKSRVSLGLSKSAPWRQASRRSASVMKLSASSFHERRGEPFQKPGKASPRLERLNLEPCAERSRAAAIRRHARISLREPFDLEHAPPIRARLLRLGKDDHALVIKLHHLVTDGWSQRLFWRELEAFYTANLNGSPAGLPALTIQYRDLRRMAAGMASNSRSREAIDLLARAARGIDRAALANRQAQADSLDGSRREASLQALAQPCRDDLKALSRAQSVTVFMALVAAFQCVLHRHTKHEDVAIGSLIANRNQIESEPLIGMFANTVVLRSDLSGDPKFSEVLRRVRQVTLDAYRNQDLPIEEVLKRLKLSRSADRNAAVSRHVHSAEARRRSTPALPGLSTTAC